MNIVCAACFTTNRIPDDKNYTDAKCGKCQQKVYSATPIALLDHTFDAFIEKNHLPVIVDFWASWCGPCQHMAPIFTRVAQQSESILFAKVETEKAQQIAGDANIRSIPTLIFFYQGREIDRISGGLNEMQLKQWIMQTINKIN